MPDFSLESSLLDLAGWARDNARRTTGTAEQAIRASALEFLTGVIQRTPVDTGRARAGWTAYLDAEGVPYAADFGTGDGVREGKADGSFRKGQNQGEVFVEVVNGVPYIVRLEYGYSRQSTAAVRITIQRLVGRLDFIGQQELERQIRAADKAAGF